MSTFSQSSSGLGGDDRAVEDVVDLRAQLLHGDVFGCGLDEAVEVALAVGDERDVEAVQPCGDRDDRASGVEQQPNGQLR
ncbi:hypothetical protein ACQEU6_06740 [Spirillospora sp. CA-108201]